MLDKEDRVGVHCATRSCRAGGLGLECGGAGYKEPHLTPTAGLLSTRPVLLIRKEGARALPGCPSTCHRRHLAREAQVPSWVPEAGLTAAQDTPQCPPLDRNVPSAPQDESLSWHPSCGSSQEDVGGSLATEALLFLTHKWGPHGASCRAGSRRAGIKQ